MDLKTCRWMTRLLYVGCLALAIIAPPLDNQILRMMPGTEGGIRMPRKQVAARSALV